jgi:hypothetical protein
LRPVAIIENLDRGMTCDVAVIGSCLADFDGGQLSDEIRLSGCAI